MTKTFTAIKTAETAEFTDYLVMVAHAGRRDRTGGKVHMASLRVWANGRTSLSACNCSNNGQLRGSLVEGRDFSAVTCRNCNATPVAAERRNSVAFQLTVNL